MTLASPRAFTGEHDGHLCEETTMDQPVCRMDMMHMMTDRSLEHQR
jgi:hypothetical protein